MASESIAVYFEPLGSVGGLSYYHETLVYTSSSGEKYLATAYASATPQGNALTNLSQAAYAADSGGESNYGSLVTETAPLSSLSQAEIEHWMGTSADPYQSQVVASGDDLSGEWDTITQAYGEVGSEDLPY